MSASIITRICLVLGLAGVVAAGCRFTHDGTRIPLRCDRGHQRLNSGTRSICVSQPMADLVACGEVYSATMTMSIFAGRGTDEDDYKKIVQDGVDFGDEADIVAKAVTLYAAEGPAADAAAYALRTCADEYAGRLRDNGEERAAKKVEEAFDKIEGDGQESAGTRGDGPGDGDGSDSGSSSMEGGRLADRVAALEDAVREPTVSARA